MADTAQLGYLALAIQTAKGTANTADLAAQGVRATSISVGGTTEVSDPDPEIGGTRDPRNSAAIFGGFRIGGDFEAYLRYHILLPALLVGAGFTAPAPVETGVGTGVFRHTFTPATAQRYLTVETSWGNARLVRRFVDVIVDSLELSLSAEERVALTATLIGATETRQAAATAVTYPTADAIGNYNGSAVTFDGLGTYLFSDLGLSIGNNASDDEYVIGSRFLADVTPGERDVRITGTLRLGTNTPSLTDLYRAAMYGSKTVDAPAGLDPYTTSAAATFGSNRFVGASTTERYRAVFTLPSVVMRAFPLDASGDDVLTAEIEARSMSNGTDPVLTVDVYNTRATAY